ncbi:MAG: hypothetical protein ACXWVP_02070 [Burkholderiales bacterium]
MATAKAITGAPYCMIITPEWKALSDTGRWMPVIRPKVKSRARRTGPVVARFAK